MRNRFARAALTGALCVGLAVFVTGDTRTERLATGEQRVLKPGYAIGDIAISNPKVCDFRVLGDRTQVMLVANGVGFATLTLWDQRGAKRDEVTIEVISAQVAKLMADLVALVKPYPNVTISTLGPRIVVGGTVNTRQDLDTVRALAQGAGNALCTVALAGGGETAAPAAAPTPRAVPDPTPRSVPDPTPRSVPDPAPRFVPDPAPVTPPPAAAQPVTAQPVTAGTASVVRDPTPPPATRTPVNKAPTPVPLGGAAGQPGVSAPAAAVPPPVAVPAVTAPPPPNVVLAPPPPAVVTGTRPSPAPAPAATAAVAPAPGTVGDGAIEYVIALYESPSSAPPPEVAGPQGKRLLEARLRTDPGREVRQTIAVGGKQSANPALMRGLSIALTPRVRGDAIDSTLVFDTNLPIGRYDQKNPVWLRSQVRVSGANGATQYVTEQTLAAAAKPTGTPPPSPSGSSGGARAAGAAINDGVSTATRAVPGSRYVPSLGGLFGGTAKGASQPKARPTMLLLVITPAVVGPIGREP